MQTWKNYFRKTQIKEEGFENYHTHAFAPRINPKNQISKKDIEEKVKQIFEWAKARGAKYYTFFAYPQNQGVLQKQENFLDLQYFHKYTLENSASMNFSFKTLEKGESDGSSFPSGGLRQTPKARAYTVWDLKSEVFLRPSSKVLYIPSFLISHNGQALDDKTIFRRAQRKLQQSTIELLSKLGIQTETIVMALGLEQQFFVIKKDAYQKRLDLRATNRALVGKIPPKTQQFSDHYYGKIPQKIEQVLTELEQELLQIGIPVKMRHQEVAPNQFQFVPLFSEAGKAIDHNMIMMEIFKQKFNKAGLQVIFHQKPFNQINGSGKHCNWSLNYINSEGQMKNLFEVPKDGNQNKMKIFKLFVLIQLKALLNHSKLYLSSVATPGNEMRLGGHQAPPRILSAFLGDAVTPLILGKDLTQRKNLKKQIPNINFDLHQENTDRNRTSPYAFTGNKFQYRAVGSSQNVCFPMAVIAATLAKETDNIVDRLQKGQSLEEIMELMVKETEAVVFNGNGYSQQWIEEAKNRGLYVNQKFFENYQNILEGGKVFVETGICKQNQVLAKAKNMEQLYKNTVINQMNTLKHIMSSQVIPRCYEFLKIVEGHQGTGRINRRAKRFVDAFEDLLDYEERLINWQGTEQLESYAQLRKQVNVTSDKVNTVLGFLPKSSTWPQFEDFINDY